MRATYNKQHLLAAALTGALAFAITGAQAETVDTRIGKLSFTHDFANGYPTQETVEKLYDERDFQRATQAYLWALPMVSIGELEDIYTTSPGVTSGDWMLIDTFAERSRLTTPNTLMFSTGSTWPRAAR